MSRFGVSTDMKDYEIDHHYFDKIDSYEKAYFLGLLYADGTVVVRKPKRKGNARMMGIAISLTEKDAYILDALNERVKNGKPMLRHIYKDGRGSPAIHFYVWSRPLTNAVMEKGCLPRKSLTLPFPAEGEFFAKKYMSSFLRGYFDGDGGISYKKPRVSVKITSSHAFCEGLKDYLWREYNIKCTVMDRGKFADTVIVKKVDKIRFYHVLYSDIVFPIHLRRKKEKFEMVLDHLEELSKKKALNANQKIAVGLGRIKLPSQEEYVVDLRRRFKERK